MTHIIKKDKDGNLTECFQPFTIVDEDGIQHPWGITHAWSDKELAEIGVYRVEDAVIPAGKVQKVGANPTYIFENGTVVQTVELEDVPVATPPVIEQSVENTPAASPAVFIPSPPPVVETEIFKIPLEEKKEVPAKSFKIDRSTPKKVENHNHTLKIEKVEAPVANTSMKMLKAPPKTKSIKETPKLDVDLDPNNTKNILTHEEQLFYHVIHGYYTLPDCFKSAAYTQELFDGHAATSKFSFDSIIFDRTETVPSFLRFKNISPMPVLDKTKKSMTDISITRAKELAAKGELMRVMWSGGIDSTLILAAMEMAKVPREQVVVHMNPTSIEAYPLFYNTTLKNYKTVIIDGPRTTDAIMSEPDGLYVHGQLGDQLYCYNKQAMTYSETDLNSDFRKFVPETIQQFIAPILKALPRPVETFYDYLWFVNFIFKWQTNKLRMAVASPKHETVSFYDCDDFQNWSLFSEENKDTSNYLLKEPSKKVIYDFNGDNDYYQHMIKVPSLDMPHFSGWKFFMEDNTYAA